MQATAFLPSRDGFSFRNDFDYPASRVGRAGALAQGYGLAGGMCLSALDRWLSGRPLPRHSVPPQPGDPLYEEFVRRQVELLGRGAWDRILDWQSRPGVGRLVGAPGVGELTRGEWRRLRRSLDAGQPAVLCVLRTRGPFANPSENPIVLATRYEYARDARRGTVWLYDPNRPGNDDVRLTVAIGGRRRTPETTFVSERVRGFIVMPYDRTAAAPLRATEIAEQTGGGLAGRAAVLRGRGMSAAIRGRDGSLLLLDRKVNRDGEGELQVKQIAVDERLVTDPVVPTGGGSPILARDAHGSVIAFGGGMRGVRGRPLPGPKDRIQVEYGPVAVGTRGKVHAFGVRNGRLVHFARGRTGSWTGAEIAAQASPGGGERLDGVPAAAVSRDHTVHVFARTEKGRLAHLRLGDDDAWTAALLPAADGEIAGDPVAAVAPGDDQITVLAVSEAGELIQIRGTGSDTWRARNLTRETAGDGGPHVMRVEIVASDGPGSTLHVFGVSPRKGLVHYWCPPTLAWRAQDLTDGRADIGEHGRVRGKPSVTRASNDQLIVAASGERGIVVYRWSAASDWTGDVLPAPPAIADAPSAAGPVVWSDARGATHLLAAFDDGRAVLAAPGRPESIHRVLSPHTGTARARVRREAAPVQKPAAADPAARVPEAVPVAEAPVPIETTRPDFEDFEAPSHDLSFGEVTLSLDDHAEDTDEAALPDVMDEGTVDVAGIGEVAELDVGAGFDSGEAGEPLDAEVTGFAGRSALSPSGLEDPLTPSHLPGEGELLDFGLTLEEETPARTSSPSSDLGRSDDSGGAGRGATDTPIVEREDWGAYDVRSAESAGATGDMDLGDMAFQPAAPLLPREGPRELVEIPSDPSMGLGGPAETARRQAEAQRIAAETAAREEAERVADEKTAKAAAKAAAKAEAERKAAEAAAKKAEQRAAARAESERKAAEAAAKKEAERKAAEIAAKKEAERRAAEKKAAAERAAAAAERKAAEAAARKEADRVAAEKKEAEKRAKAQAEADRIAAEKAARAEAERVAAEKKEAEKRAAARAEADRIAAEMAAKKEAERAAAELAARKKAEAEAVAAAKAEAERAAAQEAEAARKESVTRGQKAGAKAPVSRALEGLPLLDDTITGPPPRAQSESEEESKKPEETKGTPKPPKPKLRSIDDLLRLADEHGPTFDNKK